MNNLNMNKKAWELGFIVVLIILLVTTIILVSFQGTFVAKFKETSALDECRFSSRMQSATKQLGDDIAASLKCPVIYKTIKDDNTDKIKKIFADQIAGCWYKFNEGNVNLFPTSFSLTNYCVVCSVISSENTITFSGLLDYMAEHNIPRKYGSKNYIEYLTSVSTNDEIKEQLKAEQRDIIDLSKRYLVLFYYPKEDYITKLEGAKYGFLGGGLFSILLIPTGFVSPMVFFGTTAIGTIIGIAAGAEKPFDYGATVLLMPYDKELLSKLQCKLPVELEIVETDKAEADK